MAGRRRHETGFKRSLKMAGGSKISLTGSSPGPPANGRKRLLWNKPCVVPGHSQHANLWPLPCRPAPWYTHATGWCQVCGRRAGVRLGTERLARLRLRPGPCLPACLPEPLSLKFLLLPDVLRDGVASSPLPWVGVAGLDLAGVPHFCLHSCHHPASPVVSSPTSSSPMCLSLLTEEMG